MKYTYKQIAKARIGVNKYQVVQVNEKYYQMQRNRQKIGNNEQNMTRAIKAMLKEAEYDLLDLFTNEQK